MPEPERPTNEERAAVRRVADARGDHQAAKDLGLSVDSLLRVLADRPIRRGTLHMLRENLRQIKKV